MNLRSKRGLHRFTDLVRKGQVTALVPRSLVLISTFVNQMYGRVAQLVEQVTFNHWVTGSNPVALTILYCVKPLKALAFGGLFFVSVPSQCLDIRKKSRE